MTTAKKTKSKKIRSAKSAKSGAKQPGRAKKTKKAEKKTKKKTLSKKKVVKKENKESKAKLARYFEAVGRRKTSVARVRLFTQEEKLILVNEKPYKNYFSTSELQQAATDSLRKMKALDKFRILVKVKGGGIHSQAEAVRHGIARALVEFNPDFRKRLRRAGYLTRDPRMRERKKFGLKRARKGPQWSKR
jgi:small subunit ribosomal protein S9